MMMRSLGASAGSGFSTIPPMATTPSGSTGDSGSITPYAPTSWRGTRFSATTLPPELTHTPFMCASKRRIAHQLVGQHHRERLVPDRIAGASDGVAEATGMVLVDDRRPPVRADAADPLGELATALRLERLDHFGTVLEVRLDAGLRLARHDDDVVDAGAERLVDDDLQQRGVADRQQLLRHRLGGRQEPGSHPGRGNDSTTNSHGRRPYRRRPAGIVLIPMPTYVYKFVKTGETIEVQQPFTDKALTSVVHPRSGRKMAVKKVFTPVGVTFRGEGFYKTDSRAKSTKPKSESKKARVGYDHLVGVELGRFEVRQAEERVEERPSPLEVGEALTTDANCATRR